MTNRFTEPETVQVYPFRAEADIAVARLAADGIRSIVHQDDEGGLNPGFFARYGVRVEVDRSDLEDAFESLGIERVRVPGEIARAMFFHSGWAYPEEACGLVAFDAHGGPAFAFCLTNLDKSEHRFTIGPEEHHGAMRFAESLGLSIGAVFHSHVKSEAVPSASDLSGGADPDWIHFIVGPVSGRRPLLRGFRIEHGFAIELSVSVDE
ncbi:MAG: M67 family metallopeptidase [Actinomycetota bacterium]|nr:M67 family metallopeptidase [Actinomycetota bacterium]